MELEVIQQHLSRLAIDAWLLYDFQGINPIARSAANLVDRMLTRRWFCLVPASGEPVWLVSAIEAGQFGGVRGRVRTYSSWTTLQEGLDTLVAASGRVAMEYSAEGRIPYVSRVDAGTLELVRRTGVEIVSSADLIQWCQARWTPAALASHLEAAKQLTAARERAFSFVTESVRAGSRITEYHVQQEIMRHFAEHDLVTNAPPIVAVGHHTGDPHYQPDESTSAEVEEGDLLLIDLWAKERAPGSVYADITWMGYVGTKVPDEYVRIFTVVNRARNAAAEFVMRSVAAGEPIHGWQVDDAARQIIVEAGFGDRFIHRTGHSIGVDDHGSGVNFDNLEAHDERSIIPDICCSIEPGIYLDAFGVRSEINIYIGERRAEVTTAPVQRAIVPLLRA